MQNTKDISKTPEASKYSPHWSRSLGTGLLISIISALIFWITPNYLVPDTFFNPADAVFPYNPERAFFDRLWAWNPAGNSGFGNIELYNPANSVLYVGLFYLLDQMGIALWVLNRIYFFLPSVVAAFSIFYLMHTLKVGSNKTLRFVGVMFFLTCYPMMFLDPILILAVGGMVMACTAVIKAIHRLQMVDVVILAGAFLLLSSMLRYLGLYLIFLVLILAIRLPSSNNKWKMLWRVFWLNAQALLFFMPFLVFSFFPFLVNVTSTGEYEIINAVIKSNRLGVIEFFARSPSPDALLRLHYDLIHSMTFNFLKNPIFNLASYGVLFLMCIGLRKAVRANHTMQINLAKVMVIILTLTAFFGTDLHKFIVTVLPGVWILNNPQYGLVLVAAIYSIFLVKGLDAILALRHSLIGQQRNMAIPLLCLSVLAIALNNSMLLFDIRVIDNTSGDETKPELELAPGIGYHS